MIELHHQEARDYLGEHLPAIRAGLGQLGTVFALEFGERLADRLPTSLADGWGRTQVNSAVEEVVLDVIRALEDQAE